MTEEKVREALRRVMDPELGISVVDLGLVAAIRTTGQTVDVDLGMTSPTCPLGPMIKSDAEAAVRTAMPPGTQVTVHMRDDIAWDPSLMTPEAKSLLGWK